MKKLLADISEFKDEEVVFFIRIRGKKSYFENVYTSKFLDQFRNLTKFRTISEYKRDATFHIDLNAEEPALTKQQWSKYSKEINFFDIIFRCRGLRTISGLEAIELISRAINYFERFFLENTTIKCIVMGTVDNYIMDIMERMARLNNVSVLAITDSFMSPEYKLLSIRGEKNYVKKPSPNDVALACSKVLARLNDSKSTISLRKLLIRAIYSFCSYYIRYIVRYLFKFKIKKRLEYEYRFANRFEGFNSISKLLALFYLQSSFEDNSDAVKTAYIPLHYVPEATIDYWVHDEFEYDYERSLYHAVDKLTENGFRVVAKEHPAFQLSRNFSFYKELKRKGVILVSGSVPTKVLFEQSDVVVVWNGSTGIEAALYGKPVVRVCNSYYGDGLTTLYSMLNGEAIADVNASILMERTLETSFKCL